MKIYECDNENFLIRVSDVGQEVSEMMLKFESNTSKAPNKAMMIEWGKGKCQLQFDHKTKKWVKIEFDQNEIFNKIFIEIDHEVSAQIRNGEFVFEDLTFYTDDRSQLKWSEIATEVALNLIEFPIEIKGAGDNYLTIKSASEFSEFYKKFREEREKIRQIGRLLKYDEEKSVKNTMEYYEWKKLIDDRRLEDKIHELFEIVLHPHEENTEEATENDNA